MIRLLLILGFALLLASCQTPITSPLEPSDQVPFGQPELDLDAKLNHLQNQRNLALRKQNWPKYILLTEQLWQQVRPQQQTLIEQDAWFQLQAVPIEQQDSLIFHADPQVQAWGWLLETRQQRGLNFKRMLEDIAEIAPEISFSHNLIPDLINYYQQLDQNQVLAILLPMSDQYQAVSYEIRAGILKAYWQTGAQHQLIFINSQDYPSAEAAYLAAIKAGAQTVIGPLLKNELAELTSLNPTNLVALNFINQPANFWQFSYKSIYEAWDITDLLKRQCLQNIAIFGAASPANTEMSHRLQAAWQQAIPLSFYSYAQQNPNLRFEMSKMLNANLSQDRAAFLSRTLESPIEFFPRSRQDLDAIILLDDEKQVAVLRPQFDYFNVKLPLFASSSLTPDKLFAAEPNRDLKTISLPTFNAVLSATPVKNGLQAFGWDAYQLAINQPLLAPGLVYRGAVADHIITDINIIHSQFSWAKFNNAGQLEPLNPEKFSSLGLEPEPEPMLEDLLDEQQLEALRLELLKEINQLEILED